MARPALRRLSLLGAAAVLAGTTVMSGATPPDAGIEPVAADLLGEPVRLEAAPVEAADEPQMGLSRIPVSVALTKMPGADPFAGVEVADEALEADEAVCLSYPVAPGRYRISSPYGYRVHPIFGSYSMHAGVDFAAPLGTPIHAVTDGTVVYTGAGRLGRSSELVILEHTVADTTFYSWYVHMYPDGVFVEVGQRVRAGEVIAEVGNNGNSTGPHLHFEIHTEDTVRSEVPRTPTAMVTRLGAQDPAAADDALDTTEGPGSESGESDEESTGEPGDESGEPGGQSEEPGDGSEEPGDESEEPGDGSEEPGDESGEPGDESEEPGDGSGEPGDESGEPGDESVEPGDESGEPGDEEATEEPGDGTEEPGDGTEEPTERPTEEATERPTDEQTPRPEPTEQPTREAPPPTGEPTDQSSEGRTEAPTAVPTGDPAAEPSAGGQPADSARRSFPVRAFGTTVEPMDFLRSLGLVMVAPDQCFTP